MNSHHKPSFKAAGACPECAPRPPLRNHWFWGKNIVPRDLIDEQDYFREKLRLHHQRLHGEGIVCGLAVSEHDNRGCQDRLVKLAPGSAIDCCGHDIFVIDQDIVDLEQFESFRKLKAEDDGKPHILRLCIAYRECPTEEVPALYDDCACSDTRCAPNRILESYAIELEIDPPAPPPAAGVASYRRVSTLLIDQPAGLALDDTAKRLFVGKDAAVVEIDAESGAIKATRDLGAPLFGLAATADSARLDAVAGAAAPPNLDALDIGGPVSVAVAALRQGAVNAFAAATPLFVEIPGGALALIDAASGALALFAAGVPAPVAPTNQAFSLGKAVTGAALASSGKTLYLGVAETNVFSAVAIDVDPPTSADLNLSAAGAKIAGLALDSAAGPDRLFVLDAGAPAVLLVNPADGTVEASVALDHPPVDLVLSRDGGVAHVLTRDAAGKSFLQSVDLAALRLKAPQPAGAPFAIDDASAALRLAGDGGRIYVAAPGGVAIIDVEVADCGAFLRGGDCPDCAQADCLTLATILNWRPGFALRDVPDGAIDSVADANAKIARIQNGLGRRTLVSTQQLAAAFECLAQRSILQGPPGKDGKDGKDGANGKDGASAVDPTLAHLCAASWTHTGSLTWAELKALKLGPGVIVSFDRAVQKGHFDTINFRLELETTIQGPFGGATVRALIEPKAIIPLKMKKTCSLDIVGEATNAALCDGAYYLFGNPESLFARLRELRALRIRVWINGDLIPDEKGRALDANHLPKLDSKGQPYWIRPPQEEAYASGDGVAGGQFESWFTLKAE